MGQGNASWTMCEGCFGCLGLNLAYFTQSSQHIYSFVLELTNMTDRVSGGRLPAWLQSWKRKNVRVISILQFILPTDDTSRHSTGVFHLLLAFKNIDSGSGECILNDVCVVPSKSGYRFSEEGREGWGKDARVSGFIYIIHRLLNNGWTPLGHNPRLNTVYIYSNHRR